MDKFVEVRKLISSKNPALLKWLPGFFIRYVEKIIHQDEINDFMVEHHADHPQDFCQAVLDHFHIQVEISGKEQVPKIPETCILVANHPFGGLDAMIIVTSLHQIRPDIKFIVNDLLLYVTPLKDRFVGVNKVGKNAKESLQMVEEQFASESATFVFPAGLVSRKQHGEIKDLEWKKTFISKAKKYSKPIIPVYIDGRLTNRFYRLANFRKKLGIKLNIEMFLLADEMFKQENAKMKINIGEPILPETFDRSKSDLGWAQWVKEKVYQLKQA
ncbi:MAG: 1-acyl-sn-glycerol-3-phosphate acyltransferase [Cyclobacteriaceae bacterium]|nr:1-acyl-sn-glycerol-3-phosphate acyltransferase [Cyclobacteriaceae bacterium HetDA_MAG_MS6]